MTTYLRAACCDFKTDKNKKVPVMGHGCSRCGQRARVGSPRLSAVLHRPGDGGADGT